MQWEYVYTRCCMNWNILPPSIGNQFTSVRHVESKICCKNFEPGMLPKHSKVLYIPCITHWSCSITEPIDWSSRQPPLPVLRHSLPLYGMKYDWLGKTSPSSAGPRRGHWFWLGGRLQWFPVGGTCLSSHLVHRRLVGPCLVSSFWLGHVQI